MLIGTAPACEQTGFVALHADACATVAKQLDTCVLFREPGKSAQSLIADSYAMKGFRIDTKSCTWGPMRGFVCVDPRLSKQTSDGGSYADKNRVWTREALEGHIVEKFFGKVDADDAADWKADVMPIVLSRKRIDELAATGHISFKIERSGGGAEELVGKSTAKFGKTEVTLPWRLKNAAGATNPWRQERGPRLLRVVRRPQRRVRPRATAACASSVISRLSHGPRYVQSELETARVQSVRDGGL